MTIYILIIVCAAVCICSAVMLVYFGQGTNRYPGQQEWITAFILFVVSLFSITLRLYGFFLPSVLLGNAAQFLAYYFLILGILRFFGQDFNEHWLVGLCLTCLLTLMGTLSLESNFLNARLVIISVLATGFSFISAAIIYFFNENRYRYETPLMYAFLFHGFFSLLKAGFSLLDQGRDSLFSKTAMAQITFYEYLIIASLWGLLLNLLGRMKAEELNPLAENQKNSPI